LTKAQPTDGNTETAMHRGKYLAMSAPWRWGVAVQALVGFCLGCTEPGRDPVLLGVSPAAAYNNREISLVVSGAGFRPRLALSASSGELSDQSWSGFSLAFVPSAGGPPVPLTEVQQTSESTLTATAPRLLDKNVYAMTLTDSRGHRVELPAAFESLGPDVTPPTLRLLSPLTTDVFSETVTTFAFTVDDPSGPLALNVRIDGAPSTDPLEPPRSFLCPLPCSFDRQMPRLEDDQSFMTYTVMATPFDGAGNSKDVAFSFRVVHRPVVEHLSPTSGSVTGGVSVVIRGAWLPAEGQVFFDGLALLPAGGEHTPDGTTIRGWTPPHAPGPVRVTLKSASGTLDLPAFSFLPAPLIKTAVPPTLPTTGCHILRLIGNDLPMDASWFMGHDSEDRVLINGVTLDPSGLLASLCVGTRWGAGPVSLFLESDSAGSTRLDGAFSFEPDDPQNVTAAPECPCP